MPDLGVNIDPQPFWKGRIQKGSTIWQGLIALMPHTKFDSNRTDSSGEEDVLVSVDKIGGTPWAPLPGANGHAEQNLTSRHAPEAPIFISVHLAR